VVLNVCAQEGRNGSAVTRMSYMPFQGLSALPLQFRRDRGPHLWRHFRGQ
jgi:hypothetical protein